MAAWVATDKPSKTIAKFANFTRCAGGKSGALPRLSLRTGSSLCTQLSPYYCSFLLLFLS